MRRSSIAAVAFAASFATGCSEPTSPLDLAGIYILKTVNGLPLPFMFPPTGATVVQALDDAYTLNPQGTYAEVGHKLYTTAGVATLTVPIDAGNFTRRGTEITLQSVVFGTSSGTMNDGTFTVVQQGLTLVYQK